MGRNICCTSVLLVGFCYLAVILPIQPVDSFSSAFAPSQISSKFANRRTLSSHTSMFNHHDNFVINGRVCNKQVDRSQLWAMKNHKDDDGLANINDNISSLDSSFGVSKWLHNNKKSILVSAALVAAASFANPAPSTAAIAPGLMDIVSVGGGGSGPLTASASALIDKLSETGFYQAFSLVFVSEIGDKTFFIAGLLAMKTGRIISFLGSIGALAVMTVLSVIIGQLFHAVPSGVTQGIPLDDIAAVLAFAFFGLKTLKEASEIEDDNSGIDEEFADAEEAVEGSSTIKQVTTIGKIASTFGLVFAAEFGDRSFLSTIALSAAQNPFSVAVGAIAAHAIATGIAVAGGSYVAKYISEKAIGYIGGSLFLIFALTTALGIF